jgi:hypothetical protein
MLMTFLMPTISVDETNDFVQDPEEYESEIGNTLKVTKVLSRVIHKSPSQ